ncbi:MAG TPA: hypothetical protein VLE03_03800 [Nitrospiraceae bacterium]|nr:hypothetical protein [Nitrospiraceae bacterium]
METLERDAGYFFGGGAVAVGLVFAFLPTLLPFCSEPDIVLVAGFVSFVSGGVPAA